MGKAGIQDLIPIRTDAGWVNPSPLPRPQERVRSQVNRAVRSRLAGDAQRPDLQIRTVCQPEAESAGHHRERSGPSSLSIERESDCPVFLVLERERHILGIETRPGSENGDLPVRIRVNDLPDGLEEAQPAAAP